VFNKTLTEKPRDPDEQLRGKCGTCGTIVECQRWQATKPPEQLSLGQGLDPWRDLYYVECSGKCRVQASDGTYHSTRVFLMPKDAFLRLTTK
jgi:hypothetical protein